MFDESRQATEQIKLRVPIEEVVREKVPGLRKQGHLWVACCPFHEEGTPSFKVDPSKGRWRCYGACGEGGDVISFLQKHDRLDFREALDVLAARAGIELPRSGAPRKPAGADDPLYAVLERAADFYKRWLHRPEGAAALAYLRGRGLSAATIEAFGLGVSPIDGELLVKKALANGQPLEALIETGLARRNDSGRPYDFFRGRLMIPIRDEKGRTVGFGARRLDDADPRSPKYVNTSETEVFHKGRLIYALDRAAPEVRRSGRMILVEGYTDVMAAHQADLRNVVAVLGTAMTDEHAALVRRSGAKRVTLCFDGDKAGAQATWRALNALLPLDLEIEVLRLSFDAPADATLAAPKDPCDLLVQGGAAAFLARLEQATGWFDFLLAELSRLDDGERLAAVDRVLELLARLQKPVARDARLAELAAHLGVSANAVREQFEGLPSRLRERAARHRVESRDRAASTRGESSGREAAAALPARRPESNSSPALISRAWRELLGAVLFERELWPAFDRLCAVDGHVCPDAELAGLAEALNELARREGHMPDLEGVMHALRGHPAFHHVVPLIELAETAESARILFDGAQQRLERARAQAARAAAVAGLSGEISAQEREERLAQLLDELRREKSA